VTSTIPPWARSRAVGSGTALREASTSCQPGGRRKANSAIVFRHCRLVTASVWSTSTVTGGGTEATAATNLGTTVISAPEEASAANIAGSTGPIRLSATASALSSTTGSLSASSQDSQATRDSVR
jgi:hypothetical protein